MLMVLHDTSLATRLVDGAVLSLSGKRTEIDDGDNPL
jgi:hypothetical protein